MIIEKLVRMANQVATNFAYLPDTEQAALKVADHLQRFWEPTMRTEIIAHLDSGADDLSEIARQAITRISAP